MDNGFITIHRKILDSYICKTDFLFRLSITLILLANHKENQWDGRTIKRGQLVTGRKKLSKLLRCNESRTYRNLKKLEKLGFCNIESNNEYSIITIVKYNQYQSKANKVSNNDRTTTEQRANTNNNDNNDNNVTKREIGSLKYLSSTKCYQSLYETFPTLEEKPIRDKCSELEDYCRSKGKTYKDYLAFARGAIRRDIDKFPKKTKEYVPPKSNLTDEERKKNLKYLQEIKNKILKEA